MTALATWLAAAVAAALLLGVLLRGSLAAWQDLPNHRSLHGEPVPRVGGIAIHVAWASAVALVLGWEASQSATGQHAGAASFSPVAIAVGFGMVFAVSLLDDRRSLGPAPRLAVQAVSAMVLVGGIGPPALAATQPALPAAALATALVALCLAVLWSINLYNFMDGADGLAGGMALFGFGTYALAAWETTPALAAASAGVSGAAAGFLVFNFPPARVFLGDSGSVPLGYLAAAFGLAGISAGAWGWWLPPLAFLPFVLDATSTLLRRAARGERVWEAHRQHAYQKLILLGWSHRRNALAWWSVMAGCACACLVLKDEARAVQWFGLTAVATVLFAALAVVESLWLRAARETTQPPSARREH